MDPDSLADDQPAVQFAEDASLEIQDDFRMRKAWSFEEDRERDGVALPPLGHPLEVAAAEEKVPVPSVDDPRNVRLHALGKKWFTVEPLIATYVVADGSLAPIVQQYIYHALSVQYNITEQEQEERCGFTNVTNSSIENQENYDAFHAELSIYNTLTMVFMVVPMLLVITFIGPYSDQVGRKRVMVPALLTCFASGILTIIVMALDWPIYIILMGSLLSGMTGGMGTLTFTTFAYLADIHQGSARLFRIMLVDVMDGLGTLVGSILVGYLIQWFGFIIPAIMTQVLTVGCIAYTIFFLTETVPRNPNAKFFTKRVLTDVPKVLFYDNGRGSRQLIVLTAVAQFFYAFAEMGVYSIITYYLLDPPLCATSVIIGIFNGITFIIKAGGSMAVIVLLGKRLPPQAIMIMGLLSCSFYYFCLAAASDVIIIPFIGAVLGFASMVPGPTLRDFASKLVPANQQGSLFAGFTWCQFLSMVLSSALMNYVYAETTSSSHHGAVMALDAVLYIIPGILIIILWVMDSRLKRLSALEDVTIDGATVSVDQPIIND